jgi:hypothetical protein
MAVAVKSRENGGGRTKVGRKEEIGENKKTPKDQVLLVRACLSVLMEKEPGLF